jgi:hypothetical protein
MGGFEEGNERKRLLSIGCCCCRLAAGATKLIGEEG